MTEDEWQQARDGYQGWCPPCGAWTRECTEPDAEGYDCPSCGKHTVIGAEMALSVVTWTD